MGFIKKTYMISTAYCYAHKGKGIRIALIKITLQCHNKVNTDGRLTLTEECVRFDFMNVELIVKNTILECFSQSIYSFVS